MIEHFRSNPDRPLSHAVRAGDWLFISGQASTHPDTGELISGTFDEEFARSIANLRIILAEHGASFANVVRVGSFVRDESALPRYNELYLDAFPHPRPARTTVAMGFGFLQFEIEATAFLGE